ncbi:MAG: hypothetical protein ABSF14_16885 [Terriglobia bacterium]|jgi:hypothetical protein
MSTPTVILSAFVVILSGAKDLGSSAWVSREGNCGGSSLAPLTQNDNVSAPSVILSAFIVILSEAKDLGSSLGSVEKSTAGVLRFAQNDRIRPFFRVPLLI